MSSLKEEKGGEPDKLSPDDPGEPKVEMMDTASESALSLGPQQGPSFEDTANFDVNRASRRQLSGNAPSTAAGNLLAVADNGGSGSGTSPAKKRSKLCPESSSDSASTKSTATSSHSTSMAASGSKPPASARLLDKTDTLDSILLATSFFSESAVRNDDHSSIQANQIAPSTSDAHQQVNPESSSPTSSQNPAHSSGTSVPAASPQAGGRHLRPLAMPDHYSVLDQSDDLEFQNSTDPPADVPFMHTDVITHILKQLITILSDEEAQNRAARDQWAGGNSGLLAIAHCRPTVQPLNALVRLAILERSDIWREAVRRALLSAAGSGGRTTLQTLKLFDSQCNVDGWRSLLRRHWTDGLGALDDRFKLAADQVRALQLRRDELDHVHHAPPQQQQPQQQEEPEEQQQQQVLQERPPAPPPRRRRRRRRAQRAGPPRRRRRPRRRPNQQNLPLPDPEPGNQNVGGAGEGVGVAAANQHPNEPNQANEPEVCQPNCARWALPVTPFNAGWLAATDHLLVRQLTNVSVWRLSDTLRRLFGGTTIKHLLLNSYVFEQLGPLISAFSALQSLTLYELPRSQARQEPLFRVLATSERIPATLEELHVVEERPDTFCPFEVNQISPLLGRLTALTLIGYPDSGHLVEVLSKLDPTKIRYVYLGALKEGYLKGPVLLGNRLLKAQFGISFPENSKWKDVKEVILSQMHLLPPPRYPLRSDHYEPPAPAPAPAAPPEGNQANQAERPEEPLEDPIVREPPPILTPQVRLSSVLRHQNTLNKYRFCTTQSRSPEEVAANRLLRYIVHYACKSVRFPLPQQIVHTHLTGVGAEEVEEEAADDSEESDDEILDGDDDAAGGPNQVENGNDDPPEELNEVQQQNYLPLRFVRNHENNGQNWHAVGRRAEEAPALNPGALNLGALNPGALNPGALNPGALNPGALNLGALNPGALNRHRHRGGQNLHLEALPPAPAPPPPPPPLPEIVPQLRRRLELFKNAYSDYESRMEYYLLREIERELESGEMLCNNNSPQDAKVLWALSIPGALDRLGWNEPREDLTRSALKKRLRARQRLAYRNVGGGGAFNLHPGTNFDEIAGLRANLAANGAGSISQQEEDSSGIHQSAQSAQPPPSPPSLPRPLTPTERHAVRILLKWLRRTACRVARQVALGQRKVPWIEAAIVHVAHFRRHNVRLIPLPFDRLREHFFMAGGDALWQRAGGVMIANNEGEELGEEVVEEEEEEEEEELGEPQEIANNHNYVPFAEVNLL